MSKPTHFDGMLFTGMSDEYLLASYDTLCVRTDSSDDWLPEFIACKNELLARMRKEVE